MDDRRTINPAAQEENEKHMKDNGNKRPKIKIVKNGPYVVTGNVPLGEKIIVAKGEGVEFAEGRKLLQAEVYALCRCGKSGNAPFCDGSHVKVNFEGAERASKEKYVERATLQVGVAVDLYDDGRCAFARFCHTESGTSTWDLVDYSDVEENRKEAVRTAGDCPAGRLTAVEKNGEMLEPVYEPAVEILQDPEEGASGGIFVKGGIPLESADGTFYETRNRYVLCRCGQSENNPFCDATHIPAGYSDGGRKSR